MSTNTNNENAVYKDAAKVSIFILLFGVVEFIVLTAFLSLRLDILLGVAYGCAFSVFSFFTYRLILKMIPMYIQLMSIDVPPWLTNGSGWPVTKPPTEMFICNSA